MAGTGYLTRTGLVLLGIWLVVACGPGPTLVLERSNLTMAADGSNVQRLTQDPDKDENAAWSPAWTRLAFQSDRGGNWDIYTGRADCSPFSADAQNACDLRQLTSSPGDDLLPAWSPDGGSIAFVSTRDGNPEIYVMDSDGKNQRRLTLHPNGDWRPAWLPDSVSLVFVSDCGGSNDIYARKRPAKRSANAVSAMMTLDGGVTVPKIPVTIRIGGMK